MINIILDEIDIDIKNIKKEKNICIINEKYNMTNLKIKKCEEILQDIKQQIETSSSINTLITDEQYDSYVQELTDDNIKKFESMTLENQIINYINLKLKVDSCLTYLDSKKLDIKYV